MKRAIFLILAVSVWAVDIPKQSPSSPEEVATLSANEDLLIGGLVSPFSGQLALRVTDLAARGAQPLFFEGHYAAAPVLPAIITGDKYQDFLNRKGAAEYLKLNFRGGFVYRQLFMRVNEDKLHYYDHPSGVLLQFSRSDGRLITDGRGMTNCSKDIPSGKFDLRNTRMQIESDGIKVFCPDGTERRYIPRWINGIYTYFLHKEILPNGKIVRYELNPSHILIQSLDPSEEYTYAKVRLEWNDQHLDKASSNESADTAQYTYETLFERAEEGKDKKHGSYSYHFTMPPLLTFVSSPFYRHQTLGYNSDLQLTSFNGKDVQFALEYSGSPSRVEKLFFPVGEEGAMVEVYKISSYDSPIPGEKAGKTIVNRKDGIRIEYACNQDLRMEKISYYGLDGKLKKQKQFVWDTQGRIKDLSWKDGEGKLFWGRKYADYDSFGNAWTEIFYGDLTGEEKVEEYVLKKEYSQDGRNLLLNETNEEGRTVTYEYVPNTNLVKAKWTKKGEKVCLREYWKYDDQLNLIEQTVDDGNVREQNVLEGTTERKLTKYILRQQAPYLHMPEWIEVYYWDGKENKLLNKKELKYDKWGNTCEEHIYGSDAKFAYKITREYDEQGNLLNESNPLGHKTINTYTAKGQEKTAKSFSGRLEVRKELNARGLLAKLQEVDLETNRSHTVKYDYDHLDRCIEKTDTFKQETKYSYDCISGGMTLIEGPKLDGKDVKTISTFDALGRKITETDPNQCEKKFRYNAYGSIAEILYSDASSETFIYYKNGSLQAHIDQNGLETNYKYDIFDRIIEKTHIFKEKEIAKETYIYDTFHLKKYTDPENCITQYEYDRAGRKWKEFISDESHATIFAYNPLSELETVTESEILITKYLRDHCGQVREETKTDLKDKLLYKIGYEWDPDGRKVASIRYPQGMPAKEIYSYDPFGRNIEVKDARGYATTTEYEETTLLKEIITDPNGIETIKTYDPYGRVSTLKIGTKFEQKKSYDPAGNLITVEEGTNKIGYEYDLLNRVKTVTRAFESPDPRITRYTYYPGGELKTKTLPNQAVLTCTYSPLGTLLTLDASDDSVHQTFDCDKKGRLRSATDQDAVLTRTFDNFGNLTSETINDLTWTKTYDPLNRLASITLPDQSSILYSYKSLYPEMVRRLSPAKKEQYFHSYFRFDLSGNLLAEHLIHGLGTVNYTWNPTGRQKSIDCPYFNQTIEYDPASRIESISSDGFYDYNDRSELTLESLPTGKMIYDYDLHHNRTEKNGLIHLYNLLDEPIEAEYDLNGNLKKNGEFYYTYDALNRLKEAHSDNIHIAFAYDALDRCISKSTNGTKQLFLYHGMEELGSFNADGSSQELKVPGLANRPIALELEDEVFAPLSDYRGNIRKLISRDQEIAQSYDYTAFGEEISPSTSLHNPWRYSAKRYDPHLQLYDFGKRFYDPFNGRWITTDPVGFVDGTNLYTYAHNSPLSYCDPDGRFVFAIPLIGITAEAIFYGCMALTAAYSATGVVESYTRAGTMPRTGGEFATGLFGAALGGVVSNLDINLDISTGTSPQVGSSGYGGFVFSRDNAVHSSFGSHYKKGSEAPGFPANPDDLLKNPDWKETTHPDARKKGHRTFGNQKTGEIIRHDQGKPGQTGHRARDHYHHQVPNGKGAYNYVDGKGNPVPAGSDQAHLYPNTTK